MFIEVLAEELDAILTLSELQLEAYKFWVQLGLSKN